MKKLSGLIIFGIAFGLLEAIVVVYIHQIIGQNLNYISSKNYSVIFNLGVIAFIWPHHPILLTIKNETIEMWREFSTIIMLLSIGYIGGNTLRQKLGAFLISFATWDVFYYIFLNILSGWPNNIFNIDVYFLIPVPWVGPVITPVIISIVLFIYGTRLFLSKNTSSKAENK